MADGMNLQSRVRGVDMGIMTVLAATALFSFACVDSETEVSEMLFSDTEADALDGEADDSWTAPSVPPCFFDGSGSLCTTEWGTPGVCLNEGGGYVFCAPRGSCLRADARESCAGEWGDRGTCVTVEGGETYCRTGTPATLDDTETENWELPDAGEADAGAPDAGVDLYID